MYVHRDEQRRAVKDRPLRVAINAHFWARETTGSGQYLHALLAHLREHAGTAAPPLELMLIADAPAARRAQTMLPPRDISWHAGTTPFDRIDDNLAKVWFEQVTAPQLAASFGADLYHVPYFAPPLRTSLPVVATIHDLIPMRLPAYAGSPLVRLYTALVARAARHADLLLADSEAARRDALTYLRINSPRVRTVYLAAGSECRPPTSEDIERVRTTYGLPEQFVLYLGGFDVRKRVPLLIRALARTSGTWPLVIAGRLPERDTSFTPDPRRAAREAGVDGRVRFIGFVDDTLKPALYGAATLFVFPSIYEGFGLPPLEALACGTPVVTTDASSLPEIVGEAGRLVPPDDEMALAAALDELMMDATARRRLAEQAIPQAARFSWRVTAEATRAAYRAVTSGR